MSSRCATTVSTPPAITASAPQAQSKSSAARRSCWVRTRTTTPAARCPSASTIAAQASNSRRRTPPGLGHLRHRTADHGEGDLGRRGDALRVRAVPGGILRRPPSRGSCSRSRRIGAAKQNLAATRRCPISTTRASMSVAGFCSACSRPSASFLRRLASRLRWSTCRSTASTSTPCAPASREAATSTNGCRPSARGKLVRAAFSNVGRSVGRVGLGRPVRPL